MKRISIMETIDMAELQLCWNVIEVWMTLTEGQTRRMCAVRLSYNHVVITYAVPGDSYWRQLNTVDQFTQQA